MDITGGEVIARILQAEGVERVFGIIDGTYFGFYSALHRFGIEILIFNFFDCLGGMAVVTAWWRIRHVVAGLTLAIAWSRRTPAPAAA